MKNHRFWIILIVLVLLPFWALFAQEELAQLFELTDGYSIAFPEDWLVEEDKDNNVVYFNSDNGTVGGFVADPYQIAADIPLSATLDLESAFLEVYNAVLDNERLRDDDLQTTQIGEYPAVFAEYVYEMDDELYDQISYLIEFEEDTYGLVTFWGFPNSLELHEPLFQAIMESFLPASAAPSAEATAEASGGSCFVSTTDANTVQLRVGPGSNRASVVFLPTGEDFTVIGTNTTDEGDEWFQLDKDEVAPDSAANELWVLREDVDETGDCDNVGSASAPPIVPISAQPPPADTSGGDTTQTTVGSGESIRPSVGNWTLTYAVEADGSCLGYENVHFYLTDFGIDQHYSAGLVISPDGSAITLGGFNLSRSGANTFAGLSSYADGTSSQIFLSVNSPSYMTGSETFNFRANDGTPCSATFSFSASLG